MAAPSRPSSLQRDAADLYDAATAFIRIYQFRDRDQALRLGLTVVQAYALDDASRTAPARPDHLLLPWT
jgi:hypothetical protein